MLSKCVLQEPIYKATFNLTGLQSSQAHTYILPHAKISFNMCGGIIRGTCHNVTGTGACLTETNREVILGYASADAQMRDSIVYFNYVGETCAKDSSKNYTLEIKTECDYNHEIDPISLIKVGCGMTKFKTNAVYVERLNIVFSQLDFQKTDCEYMLNYKSAKACMQQKQPQTDGNRRSSVCQFTLPDNSSFSLAALPKGNQRVEGKDRDKDFFISVCRPVIYTPSSACPPDTNVCVYDKKNKM